MIKNKRVVVMPAYNAQKTLRRTYHDIPHDLMDEIVLVDNASHDQTAVVAQELGIQTIFHEKNSG
jgi:glycosyltransferase involved in cell wall biosynthesis